MKNKTTIFDFQAELGLTKMLGGLKTTEELIELFKQMYFYVMKKISVLIVIVLFITLLFATGAIRTLQREFFNHYTGTEHLRSIYLSRRIRKA